MKKNLSMKGGNYFQVLQNEANSWHKLFRVGTPARESKMQMFFADNNISVFDRPDNSPELNLI